MLINKIQFTKAKWYMKLPFMISKQPSLEDLKPTFVGYLSLLKFYHRTHQTKTGHNVVTPNGIGEIVEIIPPEKRPNNQYQYLIKLLDNATVFFNEKQLKYIVIYPIDFFDNKLPILLSFADYLFANPSGITEGQYTFKVTGHGYAMMTNKTRDLLEINKLLTKYKDGRRLLKVMQKHNYIIIKKENHVKKNYFQIARSSCKRLQRQM